LPMSNRIRKTGTLYALQMTLWRRGGQHPVLFLKHIFVCISL
jgi:hypothetical protein